MQVVEKSGDGLSKVFGVTVPAGELAKRLDARIAEITPRLNIKGFRPGKVPPAHIRRLHGKALMAEVVEQTVTESKQKVLDDNKLRPATEPNLTPESDMDKVLAGGEDLTFEMAVEVMPDFEPIDITKLKLKRPVYEPTEKEVDEALADLAKQARSYEPRTGKTVKAKDGDQVLIDFVGRLDGEAFQGGSAEGHELVLGSGQFIPGFEEQLVGLKAGDEKTITVTFPENYQAAHLAGKEATFDVTVQDVAKPGKLEITDETAKTLGLESAEKLREIVRGQLESQYGALTRQKVKRELLDALDAQYQFEAPSKLVQAEFDNIWGQVTRDLETAGKSFADEDTTEEDARAEYQRLAERRVRLGLVLAEMGEKAGVQITDEEMQRALFEFVRRYPGQEQEVYDFYRNNPTALQNLRAPLFEEKVVDHLLGQVDVTDVKVSKEELLADDEDDAEAAKPAKKAKAKKAADDKAGDEKPAPKKKAAKKADAE